MAHVITKIGPGVSTKPQILSCMSESNKQLKNKIYDADAIQCRINEAMKVRVRLEEEAKRRDEKLKHISLFV